MSTLIPSFLYVFIFGYHSIIAYTLVINITVMSVTAHRNLARLPLSIYENLGCCYRHHCLTRDSSTSNDDNNQHTNDTNDYNDDDERPHDHDVIKLSRIYEENDDVEIKSNCHTNDPEILKKLIISKLIQYFRQESLREETNDNNLTKQQKELAHEQHQENIHKKNILTVGDFLQLSTISLLKILDPLLTYGTFFFLLF